MIPTKSMYHRAGLFLLIAWYALQHHPGKDRLGWLAWAENRQAPTPVIPLRRAFSHNDYAQRNGPLTDALACGFCAVESDVWLQNGRLLVGHLPFFLKPDQTLEQLYLDPLRERAKANKGKIYRDGPPFYLLVDVKSEADATYKVLDKILVRYADILTVVRDGKTEEGAVTVIVSGNRALERMTAQTTRYAGIDGRLTDLDSNVPAHLMPWISDRWPFRWQGEGPMPFEERTKLQQITEKCHKHGRFLRFWATAEKIEVWKELCDAGVDLINTDALPDLQQFLLNIKDRRRK